MRTDTLQTLQLGGSRGGDVQCMWWKGQGSWDLLNFETSLELWLPRPHSDSPHTYLPSRDEPIPSGAEWIAELGAPCPLRTTKNLQSLFLRIRLRFLVLFPLCGSSLWFFELPLSAMYLQCMQAHVPVQMYS